MFSTIALVVACITAGGTVLKEVNICLKNRTENDEPNQKVNVQQIVNQHQDHGIDEFITKQLEQQRDSDTEIDIKINVHNVPHEEKE